MILGGSTNAVLHLIAIAHSVGIKLDIDDFASVSDRIPFLADIKPSGKYVMEDVYKIGGIPSRWLHLWSIRSLIDYFMTIRGSRIPPEEQLDRW
jgi:dihydroxy-acid dehydratase